MKIDYVVTYVNNQDEEWLNEFSQLGIHQPIERYRDNDLFQYNIRSVAKNMPWINQVILVVSSLSQVPKWINTDKIRIVTHKEFIPNELLPTFNSAVIESFLPNIPNLSEYFIYSNDDMYMLKESKKENFFTDDGKVVMFFGKIPDRDSFALQTCRNSFDLVNTNKKEIEKVRPFHFMTPIITNHAKKIMWNNFEKLIELSEKYRKGNHTTKRVNQYIYINQEYINNNYTKKNFLKLSCISLNDYDLFENYIQKIDGLCINDVTNKLNIESYNKFKTFLENLFPNKCIYEN